MESSLVIKVKYGDTLRRFSVHVDENNRLDLDMVGLRAKICSIFNFAADANLTLRYVDEDGDLVTLVDDDDLNEFMWQNLKFMRIDVHISNDSDSKTNVGSGGSTIPLVSPPIPNPFPFVDFQPEVYSMLEPFPEPIPEALSNFSISKAATSTPLLVSVADLISKIGQSINSHVETHVAAGTSSKNGVPGESTTSEARGSQFAHVDSASKASDYARPGGSHGPSRSPAPDSHSSGNDVKDVLAPLLEPLSEALSNLSCSKDVSSSQVLAVVADSISKIGQSIDSVVNSVSRPHVASGHSSKNSAAEKPTSSKTIGPQSQCVDSDSNASRQVEAGKANRGVVKGVAPVDLNFRPCDPFSSQSSNVNEARLSSAVPDGKPIPSEARVPHSPSVSSASNAKKQVKAGNLSRGFEKGVAPVDLVFRSPNPYSSQSTNGNRGVLSSTVPNDGGNKGKMSIDDSFAGKGESSGSSTLSATPYNCSTQTTSLSSGAFNECPFSGTYTIHPVPPPPFGNYDLASFKRSLCHAEAMSGMFHKGVRCDGCGVYPITGPRYKSKVKENYDLCCICFSEMGNETDYIRMNHPVSVHAPGMGFAYGHKAKFPMMLPQSFKTGKILKHGRQKLDSQFILDVNVIDGTMMAPSTAFTKIWRMRNNGTLVWPRGTQLVWIGGNKLSDFHSIDLEVPEDGVPVEKELDIAVEFRAPQLPGRYISYWRMASPSGHKFGQRVWVLIQVDSSLSLDSFYDGSQGLNLNIPLDVGVGDSKGPQVIDINVKPIEDDSSLQPPDLNDLTEPVNQMLDKQPRQEELEDKLPVPSDATAPPTSVLPLSVSYPIIDFPGAATSDQHSSAVDVPSSSVGIDRNNALEETLLKELEEMGFKQVDLNKEILRNNDYNLEQSVEDLCGVSEWDPILEELQEMGFRDNEMNKRLLMKNNGSIKRVVLDLINGE